MNSLLYQAVALLLLSVPFAIRGFLSLDMAAWATAFLALICGGVIMALDWAIDKRLI